MKTLKDQRQEFEGSYENLATSLDSEDPYTVISAMQRITPLTADRLHPGQREDLRKRLEGHLNDKRMRDFVYGCSQADEDDVSTVSEEAEYALGRLRVLAA